MKQRSAYTLLEVLLAMAISVLVLAGLYAAIGFQLRQAQVGRDLVGQATLVRGIFNRMGTEINSTVDLCDPARFRTLTQQATQQANQQANASGSGSSGSGSGSSTTGSGTGSSSTTGGSSSTSGTSSTTGSTSSASTSSSTTTPYTPGSPTYTNSTSSTTIALPLGVIGDSQTLNLFVSKVPTDAYGDTVVDPGILTSDLRRICYWLSTDGDRGLCRYESKVIASEDGYNTNLPTDDMSQYLMAPEVESLEFSYFDGTNWNDKWDSTQFDPNGDGITPIGSPRAIAVKIGIRAPDAKENKSGDLKIYRQVFSILSANGSTPLQPPSGAASNPTSSTNTNAQLNPNGN